MARKSARRQAREEVEREDSRSAVNRHKQRITARRHGRIGFKHALGDILSGATRRR